MEKHQIIIVGGGPAGLTAALYALRNGKSVLVLEKAGFGGQITNSPRVENYPGTLSISGTALADQFLDQVLQQGADVELEKVIRVHKETEGFVVETEEGGAYAADAVILATGVKHRLLGLKGETDLIGNGISFCAVCDGDFYAGQTVCVAGGGNSALQEAILLSEKCAEVVMLQDLPYFTGEKKLQEVLFSRPNVRSYTGTKVRSLLVENEEAEEAEDRKLVGVEIEDRETGETSYIPCDGLFVAIGLIPENENFAQEADLNAYGYFDSDESCVTKTPGLFVAGDARSKRIRQVTTACADGAVAALAACRYIDEQ